MVSAGCKSARGCDPADVATQAAWFNESFAMLRTNFQGYCEGDDLPPTAAIQGESLHGVIEVDVSSTPDPNLAGVHGLGSPPLFLPKPEPEPSSDDCISPSRARKADHSGQAEARVCVVVCLAVRCDV